MRHGCVMVLQRTMYGVGHVVLMYAVLTLVCTVYGIAMCVLHRSGVSYALYVV